MIKFLSALILLLVTTAAQAERIRDLTSVQGVRQNSLIGYGLVVGLDGTGDQTTQTPFTTKRLITCSHSWELPSDGHQYAAKKRRCGNGDSVTSSVWTSGANHRCGGFFHGKCQKLAWRYVVDDTA